MDFQGYLTNSFQLLRRHPLELILGGLLAQLLTVLSCGILAGPILGGYLLSIMLFLRQNRPPQLNDLFSEFKRLTALLPFFLQTVLILIGLLLFVVPGIILTVWWLYTLPLMVDKNLSLGEAMRQSRAKVKEKGFLMHLVFLGMITVIPVMLLEMVAALVPLLQLLQFLLPPLQCCCVAGLYLEQFEGIPPSGRSVDPPNKSAATPPSPWSSNTSGECRKPPGAF